MRSRGKGFVQSQIESEPAGTCQKCKAALLPSYVALGMDVGESEHCCFLNLMGSENCLVQI